MYVGYLPIAVAIALSSEVICVVMSAVDKELKAGCDHVCEPIWCPSLTILLSKSCFEGSVIGAPQFWPLTKNVALAPYRARRSNRFEV
jgi:hypothetical protein